MAGGLGQPAGEPPGPVGWVTPRGPPAPPAGGPAQPTGPPAGGERRAGAEGGGLFGFAGIYAGGADGGATCAIVTTAANELVAPIHDRMPVILAPEDEALWLAADLTDPAAVLPCLRACPSGRMEAYPVGSLVSSVRNDGPELVAPLAR